MSRFDRYILSQLMVLFGFFSLILILVYWVNRAVILFDRLIADGQSAGVFLEFTALSLPGIISIVLPLSGFVAAVYVTHRLSSESELVVVQATGFSPFRLARPVLIFGLIVGLLVMGLTHFLVPLAARQLAERSAEISQNVTARLLTEGQFLDPADGVTVYIRDISAEGELLDVMLVDRSDLETGEITYTAARAYLVRTERGPQLVMRDGMAQTMRAESNSLIVTTFTDFAYDVGSLIPPPEAGPRRIRQVPTLELLSPTNDLIEETGRSRAELIAEAHDRFGQGLIAVVGALIGFATLVAGGFSRFGVWRQIVTAVGFIILVKMAETLGASLSLRNPAFWPAVYLPFLLGVVLTVSLLLWAGRERRRPGHAAVAA